MASGASLCRFGPAAGVTSASGQSGRAGCGRSACDGRARGNPAGKSHIDQSGKALEPAKVWPPNARSAASIPDLAASFRRRGLAAPPKADRRTRVIPQHDRDVPARLKAERRPADRGECRPAPGTRVQALFRPARSGPPERRHPANGAAARHGPAAGDAPVLQFLGTCRPCTYWPSCTSRTGVGVAMPSPLSNRTRLPSSSGANLGITRPSSCA